MLGDDLPGPAVVAAAHHPAAPVRHGAPVVPHLAVPDRFPLDLRILPEHGPRHRRRQAEVDGVAEVVADEAEAQVDAVLARPALHRVVALLDEPRELLRTGPQHGFHTTFRGDGFDRRPEGGLREQPQATVEVRFAAAVGAGDDVERLERQNEIPKRTVVRDGQGVQHGAGPRGA